MRCKKNGHLLSSKWDVCPIDGSELRTPNQPWKPSIFMRCVDGMLAMLEWIMKPLEWIMKPLDWVFGDMNSWSRHYDTVARIQYRAMRAEQEQVMAVNYCPPERRPVPPAFAVITQSPPQPGHPPIQDRREPNSGGVNASDSNGY
jgi:hypothetical protein